MLLAGKPHLQLLILTLTTCFTTIKGKFKQKNLLLKIVEFFVYSRSRIHKKFNDFQHLSQFKFLRFLGCDFNGNAVLYPSLTNAQFWNITYTATGVSYFTNRAYGTYLSAGD